MTTKHKQLIEEIESFNLSKVAIGKALGVHYMTIYRWYKADSIKPINIHRLERLLESLKFNPSKTELKDFSTKQLVQELSDRGWIVQLTAK